MHKSYLDATIYARSMKFRPIKLILLILLFESAVLHCAYSDELPPIHEGSMTYFPDQVQASFILSIAVLVFGLILCVVEIFVLFKKKEICWDQSSIRVLGLTMVIVFGVFLITAGYSEYQIASMMGLLGTVAGYLLAKTD
jgi:hypothetical protein